ncbi:hypothetical protein VSDG_06134 [Cytospora chrysosperma]|uniref:Uncharacterized protein n=1 Tax=Cytospora chrysosperma TaxID=252740 RepID=A0A423VUC8_CYTCH|nr:hypothetical protein VSDG_06134 [Valsa sordida]
MAAVEEQGHPKAEDDADNVNQDEEFDFDIGGPEAYLNTEPAAASTNEDLTYQVDASVTLDSSYTYQESGEGTNQPLEESYDQEIHDQDYDQDVIDTSGLDATAETEEYGENKQDGHIEEEDDEDVQQVESGHFEESEVHEDEISYDETAGEFDSFDDAARTDVEQAQGTMDTATSVEYAQHEEDNLEAHADAEGETGAQVELGNELLSEGPGGNLFHEMGENETTIVTNLNSKGSLGDLETHIDAEDDMPVTQEKADLVDDSLGAADWDQDGYEDQQHTDEQPHIRVFWRTEEFRLFAESSEDNPDTYFFKGLDSLQQPLSQFLSGLRHVIDNELAPSDEVFVKVDGLGLEFGETTTAEFLEKTTFGQVLDLHNRLVELDNGSTSHELYLYLDARPSCLHRFTELRIGAEEGKGLSQIAVYYEDASTDMPADEDEEDQLEGLQDIYSDDVSISESYDEQQGVVDEPPQAEQPYNPFRVTNNQLHAVEAAPLPDFAEEGAEKIESTADTLEAHNIDSETGNADLISGEGQDGLNLEATDMLDDAPADENMQGTLSGLEARNVATEELGEDYEVRGDDEDNMATGEVVEVEEYVDVLEEDTRETHDPTDGENTSLFTSSECSAPRICYCDQCMSSEPPSPSLQTTFSTNLGLPYPVPAQQLAGDGMNAITRSNSGFLKVKDLESFSTNPISFPFKQTKANLRPQDHDAAENDDYLDLGNDDIDTTDDKPLEDIEHSGTPGLMTQDSSATETIDGDDHGNGDGASVAQDPADTNHAIEVSNQPDIDPSENELDEIDWKEGEDDEDDVEDRNPTDLSPVSISAKRSRQEDEDDDGLGDESTAKRRRT